MRLSPGGKGRQGGRERESECVHKTVISEAMIKGGLELRKWLAKPNTAVTDALARRASGEENEKEGAPISGRTFPRRRQGSPPPERSGGADSVTTSAWWSRQVVQAPVQVDQALGDHLG